MFTQIKIYFLLFIFYSILGWLIEILCSFYNLKKFVNRGYLLGPYCPIYGCGAILITLLLNEFKNNVVTLFLMSVLICGLLEYLTSYIMEKIFHLRWWDYSDKKININGRVCLNTIIPFGILGTLMMYVINPFMLNSISLLSYKSLNILFYIILSVFILDNIISLITIIKIKEATNLVSKQNREDNTEEITKKVREILLGKTYTEKRILNAYPKLKTVRGKVKDKIKQTREKIEQKIDKTKEKIDEKTENTKNELNKIIKKDG